MFKKEKNTKLWLLHYLFGYCYSCILINHFNEIKNNHLTILVVYKERKKKQINIPMRDKEYFCLYSTEVLVCEIIFMMNLNFLCKLLNKI